MNYVGHGQGGYTLETGYRYVGFGGDHGRPRRDFTCLICLVCLLSLLLLIPLLLWLLWPRGIDCVSGRETWERSWDRTKQAYCCRTTGFGCLAMPTPTTPQPNLGDVDPFNCAFDLANWRTDWSADKQGWCCNIHGEGCPQNGEAYAQDQASSYDCDNGFANWVKGWSVNKKNWCCQNAHKGCVGSGALDAGSAENMGFGAGAQHGDHGNPVAQITGIVPAAQLNGWGR